MPKRKNPFGDSAPIQLKTHVGFRQAATEEEKQNVYEKTRALLFHGANPHLRKSQGVLTVNGSVNGCTNGLANHTNGHAPGQHDHLAAKPPQIEKCVSCGKGVVSQHLMCSHCHRCVCSEVCLRVCYFCNQHYCHLCSVLSYEDEVRSLCFDCLPLKS